VHGSKNCRATAHLRREQVKRLKERVKGEE